MPLDGKSGVYPGLPGHGSTHLSGILAGHLAEGYVCGCRVGQGWGEVETLAPYHKK